MPELKDIVRVRIEESGLAIREVARRSGLPESTIRNVIEGTSESPRDVTLAKLAKGLGIDRAALSLDGGESPRANEFRAADVTLGQLGQLPKDVPVYGTVAGGMIGKGAFQLTPEVVDYVRRPFGLLGAQDIYALYVEGESMVPRFEPGDLVFVHPHRKARSGDYVVIQEPDTQNGEPRGFIKRLVGVTTRLIRTEQFNPKANLDFVIRPGLVIHKVMTDGELYGT